MGLKLPSLLRELRGVLGSILAAAFVLDLALVVILFPYHAEAPEKIAFQPVALDQKFYDKTYAEDPKELKYAEFGRAAAKRFGIQESIGKFVKDYQLENARVLDIGAGSGLLQDQVRDYTALDISATARRYFHKPFVQADARAMPFHDGEFDAAWSIWVLEHIPNPEMALAEMRRVIKPGGVLYLFPAWTVSPLAAEGYHARPYSALSVAQKFVKASIPVRESPAFLAAYLLPSHAIRRASLLVMGRPASFHYWQVTPNYDKYWEADSDAVNSLDRYEAYLWFKSRGDECVNCGSDWETFRTFDGPLIVRIKPTR